MSGKKILIVEGEVVQLTALARRLKTAGFEIVAARDGLTAISTARKQQPDLILLDLGLPAGDGFVVLQRLAMLINTGTIPIIVVCSRTPVGNPDAALKAGAIAYIHKPVEIPVLLKAINEALGISPPEPLRSLLNRLPHPSLDFTPGSPSAFFLHGVRPANCVYEC
jgi:DNA-binding response OmpR family regulator